MRKKREKKRGKSERLIYYALVGIKHAVRAVGRRSRTASGRYIFINRKKSINSLYRRTFETKLSEKKKEEKNWKNRAMQSQRCSCDLQDVRDNLPRNNNVIGVKIIFSFFFSFLSNARNCYTRTFVIHVSTSWTRKS